MRTPNNEQEKILTGPELDRFALASRCSLGRSVPESAAAAEEEKERIARSLRYLRRDKPE